MKKKIPDNILSFKDSFDLLLFNPRDTDLGVYFNFHAHFTIYYDDDPPEIFPVDEEKIKSYTDAANFKLYISLPLNFEKYTFLEVEEVIEINKPAELAVYYFHEVLWLEFTERLFKKTTFARYPRLRDYLNYHYQWYQSKKGKPENWLYYFERTYANDYRISELKGKFERGEKVDNVSLFLPSIFEEIEEWIREKKEEVAANTNEEFRPTGSVEKIKFLGNGAAFAFICRQLVDMGLVDAPKNRKNNDNAEELLQTFLKHFDVTNPQTGEDPRMSSLIKEYQNSTLSKENTGLYTFKNLK